LSFRRAPGSDAAALHELAQKPLQNIHRADKGWQGQIRGEVDLPLRLRGAGGSRRLHRRPRDIKIYADDAIGDGDTGDAVREQIKLHGYRGTIVDATIINAPSSTKNAEKARDPEMRQAKKGNQLYFGMRAHFGVDSRTKLIHVAMATPANVADSTMLPIVARQ
jgi:hypothetical protein